MGIKEKEKIQETLEILLTPVIRGRINKLAASLRAPLEDCQAKEKLQDLVTAHGLNAVIRQWMNYYGPEKGLIRQILTGVQVPGFDSHTVESCIQAMDFQPKRWSEIVKEAASVDSFRDIAEYPFEYISLGISMLWRPEYGIIKHIAVCTDIYPIEDVYKKKSTWENMNYEPRLVKVGSVDSNRISVKGVMEIDHVSDLPYPGLRTRQRQDEIEWAILKTYREAPVYVKDGMTITDVERILNTRPNFQAPTPNTEIDFLMHQPSGGWDS